MKQILLIASMMLASSAFASSPLVYGRILFQGIPVGAIDLPGNEICVQDGILHRVGGDKATFCLDKNSNHGGCQDVVEFLQPVPQTRLVAIPYNCKGDNQHDCQYTQKWETTTSVDITQYNSNTGNSSAVIGQYVFPTCSASPAPVGN